MLRRSLFKFIFYDVKQFEFDTSQNFLIFSPVNQYINIKFKRRKTSALEDLALSNENKINY